MWKLFNAILCVVFLTPALQGCTTRAWYQTMQSAAIQACRHQPPPEQARCEARVNQADFESYEKQRSRM